MIWHFPVVQLTTAKKPQKLSVGLCTGKRTLLCVGGGDRHLYYSLLTDSQCVPESSKCVCPWAQWASSLGISLKDIIRDMLMYKNKTYRLCC